MKTEAAMPLAQGDRDDGQASPGEERTQNLLGLEIREP
jgi:hypothetical protein